MLRMPGFSETQPLRRTFDTLDRIDRIEGKKYIILVSSGADTFSKLTLDQDSQENQVHEGRDDLSHQHRLAVRE